MELNEILAISGAPGLYKYVAQGKNGIIVESLVDGKRTLVSGSSKVSTLADMALFTLKEEMPLEEVFQAIYDKNTGKPVAVTSKSEPAELKQFMASVVADFDPERVHNSDIKKIALWYNALVAAGMTSFRTAESTEAEGAKPKVKTPDAKAVVAQKQAAPKAASKSKAPQARNTTARKAQ